MADLMTAFPIHSSDNVVEGFVKLKLVHGQGYSLLVPDRVYVDFGGWKFFQPHFFGPCRISFLHEDALGIVDIDTDHGDKLIVGVTRDRLVKAFDDGSQLFACHIIAPDGLEDRTSGVARQRNDGGFDLQLFHHTADETLKLIQESGHVRGSRWNFQGTKKLKNVQYAYFTSLRKIGSIIDLQQIAMASSGLLYMLLDNHAPPAGMVPIEVYRESTTNRTATLTLWVPDEILATQHLWRHEQVEATGIFYEVALPAVFRVGLVPGSVLPFASESAMADVGALKRFDYAIVGDASAHLGITAPYNEEDTASICKIERTGNEDFLGFWKKHANTDLFSGKDTDKQTFEIS